MRAGVCKVEEERILLLAVQKLQRALGEQILHPLLPLAQIPLDYLLFLVVPKALGIVGVSVGLVEESEPVVEALQVGNAVGVSAAKAPLAHDPGAIAGLLEHLGDRAVARLERHLGVAANS